MNEAIFLFFYSLAHRWEFLDALVVFAAEVLPYLVIAAAGVFLLFHHEVLPSRNPFAEFKNKWKEIFFVFLTSIIAYGAAISLKIFFTLERPVLLMGDLMPLIAKDSHSFPSGHATFFGALATAIFLKHKKAGYLFMLAALLIGLARIIAGVHFPLDILGGFLLGALIAYFLRNV